MVAAADLMSVYAGLVQSLATYVENGLLYVLAGIELLSEHSPRKAGLYFKHIIFELLSYP